jgi:hypothetical protein
MRWELLGILFLSLSYASAAIPGDCPEGMVAYWKFDGNANDSLNRHNGQLVGGDFALGKINQALSLTNSPGEYVSIPYSTSLSPTEPDNFTIIFWFKTPQTGAQSILTNRWGYQFFILNNGTLSANISRWRDDAGPGSGGRSLYGPIINQNQEYFVALNFKDRGTEPNGFSSLYINGEFLTGEELATTAYLYNDPLLIGRANDTDNNFIGLIDEVAFFNKTLSAEEINLLYTKLNRGLDYCSAEDIEINIPVIEFSDPSCGRNFNVSQTFRLIVNASDPGLLKGYIDFGDGRKENLSNGLNEFNHSYSSGGVKQIKAVVSDEEGFVVSKMINIIIIDLSANERYIAACIASPENLQQFNESLVLFNASNTRIINFSSGRIAEDSWITPSLLNSVRFNWTFSDGINCVFIGNSYECIFPSGRRASVSDSSTTGYLFHKRFSASGRNWAKLGVSA